jgi:hypothetical protein
MIAAGIRVYTGIGDRRALAKKEFSTVVDITAAAALQEAAAGDSESFAAQTELFNQTITNILTGSHTLQGVIISGPTGVYTFERYEGTIISKNDEKSYQFKSRFGLSKEPLTKSLHVGPYTFNLRAVYNYIDDQFLIMILKRTLLVVLATLCLALFTLIFQFLIPNPQEVVEERSYKSTVETYKERETLKETEDASAEKPFLASRGKNISPSPSPAAAPVPPGAMEDPKEPQFSRTPIGLEEQTHERLNSELKRCTAFGQDVVFMLIELQENGGPETAGPGIRLLIDEGAKMFLRRDLIFEKGGRGVSIVFPGIDLDEGFAKSEQFHTRMVKKYAEAFEKNAEVYIGLSSRVDRVIDAQRLMFEADGALKKAREDPGSPIVAFRSDPEKYRAFMAAQNK